ncbi:MAG: alpha-hydroxy-acid oxidizing protein [Pseudomonadota bacterium]
MAVGAATIDPLPPTAAALGGHMPIILESGIRRGADTLRSKAYGADFTLVGRAIPRGSNAHSS